MEQGVCGPAEEPQITVGQAEIDLYVVGEDAEGPAVEVLTPPVLVELVIPPDEVLFKLPLVEVLPPEVEIEPVLVEEATTLLSPLKAYAA